MARWDEVKGWPEGHRLCRGCDTMKSLDSFGIDVNCGNGRNPRCKDCRKLKSKADYDAQSHEYRMLYRAKQRAKKEGIPFSLDVDDISIPALCPVFGLPLTVGDADWTPSLDKLVPALGYVKGNVYVISNKANRLKNDGTLAEFRNILTYIENRTA